MNGRYLRSTSIAEAVAALVLEGEGATVLAGGTDLIVQTRRGQTSPSLFVDVNRIPQLRGIARTPDRGLSIGTAVTHAEIAGEAALDGTNRALMEASGCVGSWQVRNLGTIGGNLCNASPAAETATPLLALGARVRAVGPKGARELDVEDFFVGPGANALDLGELLTHISLPPTAPGSGSAYVRVSPRQAMDIAVAAAAAYVRLDPATGACAECRIALSAVAPTPIRVREAEAVFLGATSCDAMAGAAGRAAVVSDLCAPLDDHRASCAYRQRVVPVVVERALRLAWSRAQGRVT